MKRLSVIIVTYNSEKHIYSCLDSLFRYNDIGDSLEVIIVDNCSLNYCQMEDQICIKYDNKIKLIQNTNNGGYGQGNNIGLKEASAPIVLIMNPDVRLVMPIFSKVLMAFDQCRDITLYGIKQLGTDMTPAKSLGWITRSCAYIAEPVRYILNKLDIYYQKKMYFNGSCFFVRKQSFEEIGFFDENIFMYNEEEDIHYRFHKYKKGLFIYNPDLYCQHLHPRINNFALEDYSYLENSLVSLLYIDSRDGIPSKTTIRRAIQRTNISIMRSLTNRNRRTYYIRWKSRLKHYLNNL